MNWNTPEGAGLGLAAGRTAAGLGAWVAPRIAAQVIGAGRGAGPSLSLALRLFGARDLAIGVAYLTAGAAERDRWLRIGMAVDAADALAAALAARSGAVDRRAAAAVVSTALAAVATAAWVRRG